ncbi:type III secretion system effector protein [Myxococcus sp. K15C18031901]|uniref:M91 family zinc metallopeptidase n=1 Tax=Myxococcus dinghuensis TaxID=2906761 RepID=UPI0020A7B923|nr:M91 family zinc metallopeptidase [Myxococcus dinghuensis]MCP3098925.1 type III secretion system effector protein [Myxococcus dinghuensis]
MKLRSRSSSLSSPTSSPSSSSSVNRPRSNSAPSKVDTSTAKKPEASAQPKPPRPTPTQLQEGKDNLKPADYGVTHPDLSGIRTRRDSNQANGAEFADFTRDARQSTHSLMDKPVGNRMLTELNGRTQHVNPGETGTAQKPLTIADIHSGRGKDIPMSHMPRNDGTFASTRPAYRYDGQPSAGAASRIQYDETAKGSRVASLGHESVHAWRASNGLQVSPLEASKHNNADVFKRHPEVSQDMRDTVNRRLQLTEEFETVGLRPTPHTPQNWAPTDNKIRNEHDLPLRDNYSGFKPGMNSNEQNLQNYDAGSDNRSTLQRLIGTPSPIGKIVSDLEK